MAKKTSFSLHVDPKDRVSNVKRESKKIDLAKMTQSSFFKSKKKEKDAPPKKPRSGGGGGGRGNWIKKILNLLVWGLILTLAVLGWFAYDLPSIQELSTSTRKPSVTILAYDDSVLATYGDLHGDIIHAQKLPEKVTNAIIAIEDHRFYHHFGVDVWGLMRAFWRNTLSGSVVQGGSTLTQQLAKNFLLSKKLYPVNDRSLRRKVQEVLLALLLEHKLSKNEILAIYLNRVYFGSGTFGIDAAARKYFAATPHDLNYAQAALLAGLLKAPSKLSPHTNPDLAQNRAKLVLKALLEEKYISAKDHDHFVKLLKSQTASPSTSETRYFTDWVFDSLQSYTPVEGRDLVVKTTLQPKIQALAEKSLHHMLDQEGKKRNASQAALLSLSYDGAIRAMVGGRSYAKSQFNRTTQALRQPGSTFKAFVYLAAFEKGMNLDDMISDDPIRFGKWQAKNFGFKARGQLTLRDAFAYSVNTSTIRLAHDVGLDAVASVAKKIGISSNLRPDLTMALGSSEVTMLDLTTAFTTIANKGFAVLPYAIVEIRDSQDNLIYERRSAGLGRAISQSSVEKMTSSMAAVVAYGTGKRANFGRFAIGKTGTSQDHRDAWFVGITEKLVTGVWFGNDDYSPMNRVSGSNLPAQLFHNYAKSIPESALIDTPTEQQENNVWKNPDEQENLAPPTTSIFDAIDMQEIGGSSPTMPITPQEGILGTDDDGDDDSMMQPSSEKAPVQKSSDLAEKKSAPHKKSEAPKEAETSDADDWQNILNEAEKEAP